MRILITGSKGVIGTQLRAELESRGHTVMGIDLTHSNEPLNTYQRLDVRDIWLLERLFEKPHNSFDVVYFCSAEFGRHNGDMYSDSLWSTNVMGLKNMIRMQEKYKFRMVFFSSSEVYGDWQGTMSEDVPSNNPLVMLNDYAKSKEVGEWLVNRSIKESDTSSVIVRLFNTYGRERYSWYRSVNSRFVYNAIHGLPLIVYKGHERTSTFITDTGNTLANITDNFISGQVYNIGGTELHSIERLAELTVDIAGASRDLIKYQDPEPYTTTRKIVDTSKAIRDLKHNPKVSLEDGIRMTVEWMREEYK